jgi:membrane protein required for colicin V production
LNYGTIRGAKICHFFGISNPGRNCRSLIRKRRGGEGVRGEKKSLYLVCSINCNMNWIDLIIVVLLILAIVNGFINGFVKEVASLTALILGIWGAIKFSTFTAAKLYDWFDMTGQYVGIIAFLVTFGIIVVAIHFVGIIADKIIDAVSLGFLNRILGLFFGLLKTVLILSVIFAVLSAIDLKRHFLPAESIEKSIFFNPISDIAPAIFPIIGEGNFNRGFDRFKKKPDPIPVPEERSGEITI